METLMVNDGQCNPEELQLFLGDQKLTVSFPKLRPKCDSFAPGADWREYEGDFFCPPEAGSQLRLGTFLWGAHPLETLALHFFRVIITGQFSGEPEENNPLTRCTFVAVGPFRAIPPHLSLAEVVKFEEAIRSVPKDPAVLQSYYTWCRSLGWEDRAKELAPPGSPAATL